MNFTVLLEFKSGRTRGFSIEMTDAKYPERFEETVKKGGLAVFNTEEGKIVYNFDEIESVRIFETPEKAPPPPAPPRDIPHYTGWWLWRKRV